MSASPRLYRPSIDALRALIETPQHTPWEAVRDGRVVNQCDRFCDLYSDFFADQMIDHVKIYKWTHSCLAVHTSDAGVVLFDPTIRQFYRDMSEPYFLDTAAALVRIIDAHGGPKHCIDTDPHDAEAITAHDAYWHGEIIPTMLGEVGPLPERRAAYMQVFKDALSAIGAVEHGETLPWTARIQPSARSSREVSP